MACCHQVESSQSKCMLDLKSLYFHLRQLYWTRKYNEVSEFLLKKVYLDKGVLEYLRKNYFTVTSWTIYLHQVCWNQGNMCLGWCLLTSVYTLNFVSHSTVNPTQIFYSDTAAVWLSFAKKKKKTWCRT